MGLSAVIVLLFLFLVLRVPVAYSLLLSCIAYILTSDTISMGVALQRLTQTLNSFPLLAVPLFILVGYVAEKSGMAARLIDALLVLIGRVRGSLGYVNVLGSLMFSWMSGSSTADAAAMGNVMVPSMRKNGYNAGFATGLTGAASMIGPIIPPSIAAVIYGVLVHESIAAMFIAGIIPGLLIALALCLYVWFYSRLRPELTSPPAAFEGRRLRTILGALPIMAAPIIILGGILAGFFTPTESAAVGAIYLIILSVANRWMSMERLWEALTETAETTARIMVIASAGGLLAYVLVREGAAAAAADGMKTLTENPILFLILLNVGLLILGMFLEPVSALLITVPIVAPIALEYGISPIQLGVVMILNLTIGLLTPPVGLVLYVLSGSLHIPLATVVRGTLPTLVPLICVLLLVSYWPPLTTWLPALIGL